MNLTTLSNILGELKGPVRLAAWQKQRILEPASTINFNADFGYVPPEEIVVTDTDVGDNKKAPPKEDSDSVKALLEKMISDAVKAEKEKNKFKIQVNIDVHTNPEERGRPPLVDPAKGIISDVSEIEAADFFDLYTYMKNVSEALGDVEENYGSAIWLGLRVNMEATDEEANCVLQTALNFFNGIPYDWRVDTYDRVTGEVYYLPKETKVADMLAGEEVKAKIKHPRIVLIGLLHKVDSLRNLEEQLPGGILFSRSLRNCNIEFKTHQTLEELYQSSLPFENIDDKLFGPQEEEIGEEGMNPLRFAKACRQKQKATQDAADKANKMTFDELRATLRSRGLQDTGSYKLMAERVKQDLLRQVNILGFGEMSMLGEHMCKVIFDRFCTSGQNSNNSSYHSASSGGSGGSGSVRSRKDNNDNRYAQEGVLSLWDINALLKATHCDTIYDIREYQLIMENHALLTNSSYCLTFNGLKCYYEQHGRLAKDIHTLGIGSINDFMTGLLNMSLQYEADGVATLFGLTEPHPFAQRKVKRILQAITSIRDVSSKGEYDSFVEMLGAVFGTDAVGITSGGTGGGLGELKATVSGKTADAPVNPSAQSASASFFDWNMSPESFMKMLLTPGWFSGQIHALMAWLGDRDNGIIRSLRLSAFEYYGRYDTWERVFSSSLNVHAQLPHEYEQSNLPVVAEEEEADPKETTLHELLGTTESKSGEKSPGKEEQKKPKTPAPAEDTVRIGPSPGWKLYWNDLLEEILPPNEDTCMLQSKIDKLQKEIRVIHVRLNGSDERFTREERELLKDLKQRKEAAMLAYVAQIENAIHLITGHATAFYDSIRLFTEGLTVAGCGTKEFTARISLKGLNLTPYMPPCHGEPSKIRKDLEDKLRRSTQRKNAALAAMERERERRNMDENARERLRVQRALKEQKERESEEKRMFGEAYMALTTIREDEEECPEATRAVMIADMVVLWRNLLELITNRYPKTMKVVMCQNNLACVLLEFYFKHRTDDLRTEALEILKVSSATVIAFIIERKDTIIRELRMEHRKQWDNNHLPPPAAQSSNKSRSTSKAPSRATSMAPTRAVSFAVAAGDAALTSSADAPATEGIAEDASVVSAAASLFSYSTATGVDTNTVDTIGTLDMKPKLEWAPYPSSLEVEEIINEQYEFTLAPLLAPVYVIALQNYISLLRALRNEQLLYQAKEIKTALHELSGLLSDKDRAKIHLERNFDGLTILVYGGKDDFRQTVSEADIYIQVERQQKAAEAAKELKLRIAAEKKAEKMRLERLERQKEQDYFESMDPKEARKIKYAKQREADAKQRARTSRNRHTLYEMIKSDEITKIFDSQAHSGEDHSEDLFSQAESIKDPLEASLSTKDMNNNDGDTIASSKGVEAGGEGSDDEGGADEGEATEAPGSEKTTPTQQSSKTSLKVPQLPSIRGLSGRAGIADVGSDSPAPPQPQPRQQSSIASWFKNLTSTKQPLPPAASPLTNDNDADTPAK